MSETLMGIEEWELDDQPKVEESEPLAIKPPEAESGFDNAIASAHEELAQQMGVDAKLLEEKSEEKWSLILDKDGNVINAFKDDTGKAAQRVDKDGNKVDFTAPKTENDSDKFKGLQSFADDLLSKGHTTMLNETNERQGSFTAIYNVERQLDGTLKVTYINRSFESNVVEESEVIDSPTPIPEVNSSVAKENEPSFFDKLFQSAESSEQFSWGLQETATGAVEVQFGEQTLNDLFSPEVAIVTAEGVVEQQLFAETVQQLQTAEVGQVVVIEGARDPITKQPQDYWKLEHSPQGIVAEFKEVSHTAVVEKASVMSTPGVVEKSPAVAVTTENWLVSEAQVAAPEWQSVAKVENITAPDSPEKAVTPTVAPTLEQKAPQVVVAPPLESQVRVIDLSHLVSPVASPDVPPQGDPAVSPTVEVSPGVVVDIHPNEGGTPLSPDGERERVRGTEHDQVRQNTLIPTPSPYSERRETSDGSSISVEMVAASPEISSTDVVEKAHIETTPASVTSTEVTQTIITSESVADSGARAEALVVVRNEEMQSTVIESPAEPQVEVPAVINQAPEARITVSSPAEPTSPQREVVTPVTTESRQRPAEVSIVSQSRETVITGPLTQSVATSRSRGSRRPANWQPPVVPSRFSQRVEVTASTVEVQNQPNTSLASVVADEPVAETTNRRAGGPRTPNRAANQARVAA